MQQGRDDDIDPPTAGVADGSPAHEMQVYATSPPAEHFYATSPSLSDQPPSYALPKPPEGMGPARWIPPGQPVVIAGITIPGGMIYVGSEPPASDDDDGDDDDGEFPSLINPLLQVAQHGGVPSEGRVGRPSDVDRAPGELREITLAVRRNRETSAADKRRWLEAFKAYGATHHYKPVWASRAYKARFSVWPNAHKDAGFGPVFPEAQAWITAQAIMRSKRGDEPDNHAYARSPAKTSWDESAGYSDASPQERYAYLAWLASGRQSGNCDISLVFLFFYGLERRVLTDLRKSRSAKSDWSAITRELGRLLAVYGNRDSELTQPVTSLLELMAFARRDIPARLYQLPVPELKDAYGVPFYVRLALGQAAVDQAPVPAHLALAWLRADPMIFLRTPAQRCPSEFDRLFELRYHETLGNGILLHNNHLRLKYKYHLAARSAEVEVSLGDLPDVADAKAPQALCDIANRCAEELAAFSRALGRDQAGVSSAFQQLLLPRELQPDSIQSTLHAMVARVRDSDAPVAVALNDVFPPLGDQTEPPDRRQIQTLARALEAVGVGMEPHVLGAAKLHDAKAKVVLFSLGESDKGESASDEYQTATLMLEVAVALAQADDLVSREEVDVLDHAIDGWTHLPAGERRRLHAHVRWLIGSPQKLSGLKRKLDPLDMSARRAIARLMVSVAQSDGYVAPEEVRLLQKMYKALQLDAMGVFDDVQAAGAQSAPVRPERVAKEGLHLDPARIEALKKDTARVSALLTDIFSEDAVEPPATAPARQAHPDSPLPGLDEAHAALARLLASKPRWTRAELERAATNLNLWLDGALEEINEAAFAAFDSPLCEGDDPVDVDTQLLENLRS